MRTVVCERVEAVLLCNGEIVDDEEYQLISTLRFGPNLFWYLFSLSFFFSRKESSYTRLRAGY
jgi:hypothetical protein